MPTYYYTIWQKETKPDFGVICILFKHFVDNKYINITMTYKKYYYSFKQEIS